MFRLELTKTRRLYGASLPGSQNANLVNMKMAGITLPFFNHTSDFSTYKSQD